MYMEELARHRRAESGEESPQDTPVEGDIADMADLGVKVEHVS